MEQGQISSGVAPFLNHLLATKSISSQQDVAKNVGYGLRGKHTVVYLTKVCFYPLFRVGK